MVVGLRHSIAYAEAFEIALFLFHNAGKSSRIVGNHPVNQCGTQIKTDLFKITQFCIRTITLIMDAFVPVAVGLSAFFLWNLSAYRVFSRRLIVMSVN